MTYEQQSTIPPEGALPVSDKADSNQRSSEMAGLIETEQRACWRR
jgi:hypothetical protein